MVAACSREMDWEGEKVVAEVPAVSPSAQALPASGSEVSVKGVWLGAEMVSPPMASYSRTAREANCSRLMEPRRSWPLRRAGIRFMAMASLTRSTAHSSTGSPVMVVVLSPPLPDARTQTPASMA